MNYVRMQFMIQQNDTEIINNLLLSKHWKMEFEHW